MIKKVCHISTAHNENDSRILLKECQSLSKAGYEVYLIVTSDSEKKLYGTNIIPLNMGRGRLHRIFSKRKEAYEKALKIDADVYHFHDPELISLGLKLKKKGKKVIYDVHEDMPKQILNKKYLGPIPIRRIFAKVFNSYERKSSKSFDAVISVTDEIKEKFKQGNSITVKNYAMKDIIDKAVPIIRDDNKIVIIYVGAITEIRGIKELIKATNLFKGEVELWILGQWETESLFEECKNIDGYEYCKYFGSLLIKDVYRYVKAADIGMCTLYPTENYKESIPIKVLEYMACGLPIVLSNFEYWNNMFGNVGEYVNSLDINDIKRGINNLIRNKENMRAKGLENRKVFLEKFSWDVEEEKLIDLYKKI